MFSKVKYFLILLALSLGGGLFWGRSINHSTSTILIESEESKTKNLTSVYNQIKWVSSPKRDIWMMNQSHFGSKATIDKWERLAIIVDKTKNPMTARFYQLSPGPLEWSDELIKERVSFRASCFTCHSNGPRAIRPLSERTKVKLGISEKLKILIWNLRIKTYGRIHYDKSHDREDVSLSPPFHYLEAHENDELKVGTCIHCHKEDGLFARGALVRQQSGTIKNMLERGHMPPPGFYLSLSEKKKLRDFLRGF